MKRALANAIVLGLGLAVTSGCGGGHATSSAPPTAEVPPGQAPPKPTVVTTQGAPPTGQAVTGEVPVQEPSDALGTGWRYRFQMTSPPNDNFAVTTREMYLYFKPDTSAVHFQVENRTGVAFKILWDECTFTDIEGRRFRAVHRGITYDRRDQPQEPTWVQAGQRYADYLIPVDALLDPSAATGGGQKNIVPTDLRAQSLVGRVFSCHLKMGTDNLQVNQEFDCTFKVVSTYRD